MQTVWCVMWQDTYCVMDGIMPSFLQSIHSTKRSANQEASRLRKIASKHKRGGKITTRYSIQKWGVIS